jgi:hypothetical protein
MIQKAEPGEGGVTAGQGAEANPREVQYQKASPLNVLVIEPLSPSPLP